MLHIQIYVVCSHVFVCAQQAGQQQKHEKVTTSMHIPDLQPTDAVRPSSASLQVTVERVFLAGSKSRNARPKTAK